MADPFDEWVRTANGGRKTTLRQQFELGVKLFVESLSEPPRSSPQWNQKDMVDKVIQLVEDTPFRREGLVSWQGLEVGWFRSRFCSSPFMRRVSDFGCEAWFVRRVCVIVLMVFGCFTYVGFGIHFGKPGAFVDSVLRHGARDARDDFRRYLGLGAPRTEKPTIFLSYTGGYKWSHVVECLQQLDWDEVFWFDLFCVNQFAWTGSARRSSQEEQSHNEFLDDLKGQIQEIGRTVLVLRRWDNVMETLSQIWVLWEVFVTAACSRAKLEPLLTKKQEARFASSYKSLDQAQFLADIDANNANAADDADRESILARMQGAGLDQVNEKVRSIMRKWLTRQCVRFKDEAAERQLRAAAEGARRQLGVTHPETHFCTLQLACMQRRLGYTDEAELNLRNVLQTQQRILGVNHPETGATISTLATFLKQHKRYEEASRFFGVLLHLRWKRDKLDAAVTAIELMRCLSCVDDVGKRQPGTMLCMLRLALFLKGRGRCEEASMLFKELLQLESDMYGPAHHKTRMTRRNVEYCVSRAELLSCSVAFSSGASFVQLSPNHKNASGSVSPTNAVPTNTTSGSADEAPPALVTADGSVSPTNTRSGSADEAAPATGLVTADEDHFPQETMSGMAKYLEEHERYKEASGVLGVLLEHQLKVLGSDHPHTRLTAFNLKRCLSHVDLSSSLHADLSSLHALPLP